MRGRVLAVILLLALGVCLLVPPAWADIDRTVLKKGMSLPEVVQKVIAGANEIADFPYVFGGGHGSFVDNAYDCSGSVSYVLHKAGLDPNAVLRELTAELDRLPKLQYSAEPAVSLLRKPVA